MPPAQTTTPASVRTSAGTTPDGPGPAVDAGLLLLRLALGLTVAAHGAQKLFGWFDGGGLEGTEQFFSSVGYPSAGLMALIAGLTETFGGLALAAGLLTPLAGAAVLGTMVNALAVSWGDGFFAQSGGVEYELLLVCGAAGLTLTGPGRYAADRALPFAPTHRLSHGLASVLLALVVAGVVLLLRD